MVAVQGFQLIAAMGKLKFAYKSLGRCCMRDQNSGAAGFRASLLAALKPMLAVEFIPTLMHFDSRGGGEVIRLMMEESGTFF